MKIIVDEIRKGKNTTYNVTKYDDNGQRISGKTVYYLLHTIEKNGYTYYFLHDQNGNLCKELFGYVNYYKFSYSNNSKLDTILYVKRLLEFSSIIETPIYKMKYDDFNAFQYFISGLQIPVSNYELYVTRNANSKTSNAIINACKDYMQYCGYKNMKLFKPQRINRFSRAKSMECPKFISIKEFQDIIKYIKNDNSISRIDRMKYMCIYRLMFDAGLRVGEVLGLTLEDFEKIRNDKGELFYKVYIRNRLSDGNSQQAKRCMNVLSKNVYTSSDYNKKNIGYQVSYITPELYEDIMDYFDNNFDYFERKRKKYPMADSIYNNTENYYIFTNTSKASPLNVSMLYRYTRAIFSNLGYPLNKSKNSNNLLHRFRHGFCMKLLYVYKIDPFTAIHYTRHASVRSLEAYNNPTDEQLTAFLEKTEEY